MSSNTERLGRNVRRADRLKTKIEMLPTLKRNIPLTEPMSEEQILQMDNASLSILEEVGVEFTILLLFNIGPMQALMSRESAYTLIEALFVN